jgi:hypothetical protein
MRYKITLSYLSKYLDIYKSEAQDVQKFRSRKEEMSGTPNYVTIKVLKATIKYTNNNIKSGDC